IDADIAMLDIAGSAQAAPERVNDVHELAGRFHAEKPDHRHRRRLRARREGPRRRRPTEQRDELAPAAHSITSSARARTVDGMTGARAWAVRCWMDGVSLGAGLAGSGAGLVPVRGGEVGRPAGRPASKGALV